MSGRFITLDGSEGVGKSTQLANIQAWCTAHGITARYGREPGGTPLGERLRAILLDRTTDADPLTELLLLLAARRAHLQQTILPALARGEWYISDRYRDATYAYQHYGRGIPLTTLSALETASETDRDKRAAILQQAEKRLIVQHALIPVYYFVSKHLVKPYVKGYEENVMNHWPSKYMRLEKAQ